MLERCAKRNQKHLNLIDSYGKNKSRMKAI